MIKLKTYFIINDDPLFIHGTKRLLKETARADGILFNSSGHQVISKLTFKAEVGYPLPGVIITDLKMPIRDGRGFLEESHHFAAQSNSNMAIYKISQSIYPKNHGKVKRYPIVAKYFPKPANPANL